MKIEVSYLDLYLHVWKFIGNKICLFQIIHSIISLMLNKWALLKKMCPCHSVKQLKSSERLPCAFGLKLVQRSVTVLEKPHGMEIAFFSSYDGLFYGNGPQRAWRQSKNYTLCLLFSDYCLRSSGA